MEKKVTVVYLDGTTKDVVVDVLEPEPPSLPEPTQLDQIQAQVTYTALKTGTLINQGGAK